MNPLRRSNQIGPKKKEKKKKTKKTKKSKHTCPNYSNDPAWKDDYIKPNLWPLIQQQHVMEENLNPNWWGIEADCNPYGLYATAG
jgi:hypothetical protein